MSENPAEDRPAQDIDRAIEELEAAAKALNAPEVRRALQALSDAAKAVATIQDAVKAATSSTSSVALRELVADEVRRALALSGQAAQQAGDQPKTSK